MSDHAALHDDLPLHALGELAPGRAAALAAHLAECPACAAELEELRATLAPLEEVAAREDPELDWATAWSPPARPAAGVWGRWALRVAALVLAFAAGVAVERAAARGPLVEERSAPADPPRAAPPAARGPQVEERAVPADPPRAAPPAARGPQVEERAAPADPRRAAPPAALVVAADAARQERARQRAASGETGFARALLALSALSEER